MASGRQHQYINLVALGGGALLFAVAAHQGWGRTWVEQAGLQWLLVVSFLGAFLAGTFLITPDLDLAEQHVLAKRNWGRLGIVWVPYGYFFRHRGFSHTWVFGPLTRLVYLAGLLAMLAGAAYFAAQALAIPIPRPGPWFTRMRCDVWGPPAVAGLAGFYMSQWLHLLADGVGPLHGLRRLFTRW